MKVYVCVKQVPNTHGKVRFKKDGSLDRASMATIINPDDLSAVEIALQAKDSLGATVIAVTMGPPSAASMMHELYAMGVDRTIIISGRELGGSDTFGTSQVLAAAIQNDGFGKDDVIICGQQTIDGDTAQVGPEVAEKLGVPQLTNLTGASWQGSALVCQRAFENASMRVRLTAPFLVCCKEGSAKHRYMRVDRILSWREEQLEIISYEQLKHFPLFDESVVGGRLAPTIVLTSFPLPKKGSCTLLSGENAQMAQQLADIFVEKRLV